MSLVLVLVVVWGVVIAVWLGLDWLGDPNRGRFRPQRDRSTRGGGSWWERRSLKARRDDALVRSVLRDRYGRSSLRLHWSEEQELDARAADDDVTTMSQMARPIPALEEADLPVAEVVDLYDGRADEPDDDEGETPDDASNLGVDEGPAWALPTAGWQVGDDPLAPTRRGTAPAPTTVRSRVWKNLGERGSWDDENRERLRSGKPPRRRNPLRRTVEHASVDIETGTASWPDPAVDPFAPGEEPA